MKKENKCHVTFDRLLCLVFLFLAVSLTGCATTSSSLEAANKVRFEDTEKGLAIKINDGLLFKFGESAFLTDADSILDELMSVIKKARGRIFVEGHTDTVGSDAANLKLSKLRADTVARSLTERKVLPTRIVATGYGSSRLEKSPERTPEDARLNRRAVIVLEGESRQSIGADGAEARLDSLLTGIAGKASEVGGALKDAGSSLFQSIKGKLGS
ncbi:MAG: OmpA family protein [Hydrogenophaga sp.]|uniref:OmpA family protein n=1 Tax=Hydrogenophaga sp. TaxID=1904254 RepID=UPI002ABB5659|nr:OmpA family protein [Hydrogenophaga sp.]MDZ4189161.1 OmpA family protein [Hydrogenophaga sp.]